MGTQLVHTICMQTSDAVQKAEGEFVMKLAGDNPRINAVKLALGSMEFPMVQWTVEEDWNMIYFSEGFRLKPESSWMRLEEKTDKEIQTIQIQLPLHLNAIVSIKKMGGKYFAIKTQHPHGLWVEGKRSVISCIYWGDVDIICTSLGRVNLTNLLASDDLSYLSETEFMIESETDAVIEGSYGFVHVPTIPSPEALCDMLTFALNYTKSFGSYSIKYNARENRASLMSTIYPEMSETLRISLFGNELCKMLGYPSEVHSKSFRRKNNAELSLTTVRFDLPETSETPLILPSEAFPAWMRVNLMPGWYAPSNRPMCTGAPLRITQEFENAFNRLHFPVPEKIPRGHATSHFLVFADSTGMQHMCPIFAGKYSPNTLCSYLEDEMTRLSQSVISNVQFSVDYDYDSKKFTFACELKSERGIVVPAPFSLIFNHPASIDSTRLGFPPSFLKGSDTYTSQEVFIPHMMWSDRMHFNTYRISEIGHQKRFLLEAAPLSQMIGIIKEFDSDASELIVMTYVGQLPYSNGLQKNDVVSMMPTNKAELFTHLGGEGWKLTEFSPCPLAPSLGKTGVVVDFGSMQKASMFPSVAQTHVRIRVRYHDSLSSCIGTVVSIVNEVEPFNMCFGKLPRSIPSKLLGFGEGAIQWGVNGSISSGNLKIPPFIASGVHSLDHPDYVLLYLEEGKKNLSLQHASSNTMTAPFAKLVLYPMFREERMLPRDTMLLGSEMLSQFTLKFRNPDGTPYHFHNADFSFSLNFIRQSDN